MHDGIDYYAFVGTKLYPIFKGKVKEINNNPSNGWGKYVIIESSDKTSQARYAHMQDIYVKTGDTINDINIPQFHGKNGDIYRGGSK